MWNTRKKVFCHAAQGLSYSMIGFKKARVERIQNPRAHQRDADWRREDKAMGIYPEDLKRVISSRSNMNE